MVVVVVVMKMAIQLADSRCDSCHGRRRSRLGVGAPWEQQGERQREGEKEKERDRLAAVSVLFARVSD